MGVQITHTDQHVVESSNTLGGHTRWRGIHLLFAAIFLGIGIYLRLQQLDIQWLTDDEWHAIHKIIRGEGYASILLSFGYSDYCIPLTLFYKLLSETIGLSELRMRSPMLLSGLIFLAIAPLWLRLRLGARTAILFGFLLAVSPLLINFSRYARPYMVTLLLGSIALCSLAIWLRSKKSQYSVIYGTCAIAASYMHLIMMPFFVMPILLVSIGKVRRHFGLDVTIVELFTIGVPVCAGIALLTFPPLIHDWNAIDAKATQEIPAIQTIIDAFAFWYGTQSRIVMLFMAILSVVGLHTCRRNIGLEISLWLAGLAGIVGMILVFHPAWIQTPLVFARYLLPVQPLLLALTAAGIVNLTSHIDNPMAGNTLAALLATACVIGTPLPAMLVQPNNFTLHSYYQFNYKPSHNLTRTRYLLHHVPSPFWDRFSEVTPASQSIAIAGQPSFETFFVPYPIEQATHRQRLFSLQTGGACGVSRPGEAFASQGIYLRNAVSLTNKAEIKSKGIDWIVFEYLYLIPDMPISAEQQVAYINRCRDFMLTEYGQPSYEDASLIAFQIH